MVKDHTFALFNFWTLSLAEFFEIQLRTCVQQMLLLLLPSLTPRGAESEKYNSQNLKPKNYSTIIKLFFFIKNVQNWPKMCKKEPKM